MGMMMGMKMGMKMGMMMRMMMGMMKTEASNWHWSTDTSVICDDRFEVMRGFPDNLRELAARLSEQCGIL